jgi:predicted aspartyl protease
VCRRYASPIIRAAVEAYYSLDIDGAKAAAYLELRFIGGTMGHFHQRVKLLADKTATVDMLVDTGATYSLISPALAKALGVKRLGRSITMPLADGRHVKRPLGAAVFRIADREAGGLILIGDVAEPILGVEVLEALGLAVDPVKGRLVPTRGYAVRG